MKIKKTLRIFVVVLFIVIVCLLYYSNLIFRPEGIVLKLYKALQMEEYDKVEDCLSPEVQKRIGYWYEMGMEIQETFLGEEYEPWGKVLSIEGATNIQVLNCQVYNKKCNYPNELFNDFANSVSFINENFCNEADVLVKFKYAYDGQDYTNEVEYHVVRYKWAGWRVEL